MGHVLGGAILGQGLGPELLVRRSASGLTELLARELRSRGREVEVEHLHVHLPRVLTTADRTRTANAEQEIPR
ncbi:hypothetical protein ABT187_42570 [Streptomyces sp. NPDC001817]|uniref:hypothetical protein n=1 Tax=Streptomyces sp. NPDC001817 TaxID=3154398 RepID=UPI0033334ABB